MESQLKYFNIDGTVFKVQTIQKEKPKTFFDFCAGIGAGRLGLEKNGLKCLGFSEIEKSAEQTYRILHKTDDEKNFGDLTKIKPSDLPDFDVMIAGFPCQAFSVMGTQKGFEDKRGQIIYYLADILKEKRIPYFILENVKGLLTHDRGRTIKKVLEILDNAGYKVFNSVLNSLDYGVPQMRERIYFVGIRKDLALKDTFKWPSTKTIPELSQYLVADDNEIKTASKHWLTKYNNNKYNKGAFNFTELCKRDYLVIDTRQSDLRLYDKRVPTLRAARQGVLYVKDGGLRAITGYEGLLLQGFPAEYANKTLGKVSNTTLLFQVGNAMTVNVIDELCKSLIQYLQGE